MGPLFISSFHMQQLQVLYTYSSHYRETNRHVHLHLAEVSTESLMPLYGATSHLPCDWIQIISPLPW
jgi:hypothetical protein